MNFHRIFPFYGSLYIHKHQEFHGFSSILNLRGSEDCEKSLCFLLLFLYYGNSLSSDFGNCMDFCLTQKISENHYFGMFVFSHIFPLLWEFTISIFWELYGFLLHQKQLRNPLLWNVCFFPYFSRIIAIRFSHVLGIVWISASSKTFKKPKNLKCLCFPILFPYYGNSFFLN